MTDPQHRAATPIFSTIRVDANGTPLTAAPEHQFQTTSARVAATHAAAIAMTRDEFWSADMDSTEGEGHVTWTFTPTTGSPIHIRVTEVTPKPAAPAPSNTIGHVTIHRTNPNWAATFAMADALAAEPEPEAVPDVPEQGTPTGTRSQWDRALADLRDHLQDVGVPPETTDLLVIRHDSGTTWLRDLTDGRSVMELASPDALQDAKYAMAWAYTIDKPRPVTSTLRPYHERASQRATAAV